MADRHQIIQDAVKVEWTKSGRGRLYNSPQVLAIPYKDFQRGIFIPKWFGPLKRVFKGFPDTFGFEYKTPEPDICAECLDFIECKFAEFSKEDLTIARAHDLPCMDFKPRKKRQFPIFCTVEIKTRNDNLSVHQKRVMRFLVSIGAFCYIAKENKNDDGYSLRRWEG